MISTASEILAMVESQRDEAWLQVSIARDERDQALAEATAMYDVVKAAGLLRDAGYNRHRRSDAYASLVAKVDAYREIRRAARAADA